MDCSLFISTVTLKLLSKKCCDSNIGMTSVNASTPRWPTVCGGSWWVNIGQLCTCSQMTERIPVICFLGVNEIE